MLDFIILVIANESNFRDTFWYDLIMAVLTGVLSATVFFLSLRIFKPKIKTCGKICKVNDNGTIKYYAKFYNSTRSDIENVSVTLHLLEDYYNGSAKNYTGKTLKIKQNEFKLIPGKKNKKKDIHNNCMEFWVWTICWHEY